MERDRRRSGESNKEKAPERLRLPRLPALGIEADQEPLRGGRGASRLSLAGEGATLKNFLFHFSAVVSVVVGFREVLQGVIFRRFLCGCERQRLT